MAVLNLFSRRKKAAMKAGQADVYVYDSLPGAFRNQVIHIWSTAIGDSTFIVQSPRFPNGETWEVIASSMARESGVLHLSNARNPFVRCQEFFLRADTDAALDLIELTFSTIDQELRYLCWSNFSDSLTQPAQHPDDAIRELNERFRENGIGYEYHGGKIVRIDEQFLHAEVTKPALALLYEEGFSGAAQEFLKAHEHYRHKDFGSCMVEALKAFESTLKTICQKKSWRFDPAKDTASKLLEIVFANQLIPDFMQAEFSALKATLESGLPTTRNKFAGHGQGAAPKAIPDHFAAYALHLAAANILLLVRAHRSLR